ncbi:hypothetical protein Dvina_52360 [Dactylosporangium vinaceum]|uniref:MaoC family dehydratase n=1 Tax=Dactylosporangium vinaceum TaxID=53362 RepID=A0ABV5MQK5_9ACTN|nr:MaoC/PaaZ C-terminal domain-containing protein [Dactylosporangium vinaceum]UAB96424.1 hypothetical protein Dvina_52360 [Dactylosporangium vinaceum]
MELQRPPKLLPLYRAALLRRPNGTVLPERELRLANVSVDVAHLAEYDRVCGFRLRDELPATYPHVLAFPMALSLMTAADFPFPAMGIVHVANEIRVLRPLRSSDSFALSVRAEDLRPHERGRQFDMVATASIADEPVWIGRSTYLKRDGGPHTAREKSDGPDSPRSTAIWGVRRRTGPDYARVSGDRNPIHISRLAARAFGFKRTIAHGMWTKARCLAALEGRLPERFTVSVQFKRPILLPATVAFANGGARFAVHDGVTGAPHLTGTIVDHDCADPDEGAR